MRKIGLLFILYCMTLCPTDAQRLWTLDECMDYAIEHNTEMRHLQNEQHRREINAQASKDARLPRINGDIRGYVSTLHHKGDGTPMIGRYDTSTNRFDANTSLLNMGLTGIVPLYTGNRLSSQIKADKYSLLAAKEDVRSAGKDLRIQVAAAYLQVLYNKGEEKIAQERLEVSRLLLTRARSLYDKGKRPESDVAEASAMVSRDEALLTAAEGDFTLSKLDLKQLLNMPDSIEFDVCEPTDSMDVIQIHSNDYYTQTSSRHPAVQSAHYSILQAEQGVTAARSGYHPTLSLFGELGTNWVNLDTEASRSGHVPLLTPWRNIGSLNYFLSSEIDWKRKNFFFGVVGLQLSIPIFNAFETRARIRTAKVNLEDAKLAHDDALQRIQKDISQARQGAVTAHKRYEAEIKAEESSALAYRYVLKRYDAGMATLFDLSQSRQQWFTASENALRMKYEYLIRKRILDILTQLLTQDTLN
jgi:outer membrane protein